MKQLFIGFVVGVGAGCCALTPASAQQKPKSGPAAQAIATECFKQAGYSYDPASKKWVIFTSEDSALAKGDLIRECIARGTGIPRTSVPITQQRLDN
jgi:hypothetical protein